VLSLLRWLSRRQMQVEGGFQGRTHKLVDGCYSWWHGGTARVLQVAARQVLGMEPLRRDTFEGVAAAVPDAVVAAALEPPPEPTAAGHAPSAVQPAAYSGTAGAASPAELAQLRALAEGALAPFDHAALQRYVLRCCQQAAGGLRDKPSKRRDFYHTCYCLSGMSAAQHDAAGRRVAAAPGADVDASATAAPGADEAPPTIAAPVPASSSDPLPGVVGAPTNALPPVDVLSNVRVERSAWAVRMVALHCPAPDHAALLAAAEVDGAGEAMARWAELVAP